MLCGGYYINFLTSLLAVYSTSSLLEWLYLTNPKHAQFTRIQWKRIFYPVRGSGGNWSELFENHARYAKVGGGYIEIRMYGKTVLKAKCFSIFICIYTTKVSWRGALAQRIYSIYYIVAADGLGRMYEQRQRDIRHCETYERFQRYIDGRHIAILMQRNLLKDKFK